MKYPIACLSLLCGALSAAPEADWTAWKFEAPFEIGRSGMTRLELPPPLLDVSRADLGDLRVLAPGGVETAYLIPAPSRGEGIIRDGADFTARLSGRSTVITTRSTAGEKIEGLRLVSPAREFLKSVAIESREEGAEWRTLSASEVIFRQSGGAERLTLPISAGPREEFRITVDDGRSLPVPFTGVRLISRSDKPETAGTLLDPGVREELPGETRLTLDLGARNLHVAGLRFRIQDAVFSRPSTVAIAVPTADGSSRLETLNSSVLYRVLGERGESTEELFIPVRRRIAARQLTVTFRNGDSPPLAITGTELETHPTMLAFHAGTPGAWRILSGNPAAKTPAYDLTPLRADLTAAGGQHLTAGEPLAKPDYQPAPVLPNVETAGVDIGLADWSRRRAVKAPSPGVIRIELDARVLAACRRDLGDLRLIRNGRQIPYLVHPETVTRELKPLSVAHLTDPKRPTVSRWEITLPVDGLPVAEIAARSPATLFSRRFVATVERRDELGNTWPEQVGSADWSKSGTTNTPLRLVIGGERLPARVSLETDHGDNPPITIEEVVVRFAAPSITAKVTDTNHLTLYYGNPKALVPRYDLNLVRKELLAADPRTALLGEEELLKPEAAKHAMDAGSPWLWLALGVVVVALLVIVARLLPRTQA